MGLLTWDSGDTNSLGSGAITSLLKNMCVSTGLSVTRSDELASGGSGAALSPKLLSPSTVTSEHEGLYPNILQTKAILVPSGMDFP